jgi:hypothetical protein
MADDVASFYLLIMKRAPDQSVEGFDPWILKCLESKPDYLLNFPN